MLLKQDLIYRIWPLFIIVATYLIFGLSLQAYHEKENLTFVLNQYRHPFFDVYFKYITYAGNSIFTVVLCIYYLYKKPKHLFYWATSSLIFSSIIILLLKRVFFINHVRPVLFMERLGYQLNLVENVTFRTTFTFPSGHSNAAIVLGVLGIFLIKNRLLQFALSLIIISIPISRIYLTQHFMLDTIGGLVIGLTSCFICYYLILPHYNLNNHETLIQSLKNKKQKS